MPIIVEARTEAPFTEFVLEFRVCRAENGGTVGFVMPWLGDGGTLELATKELGRPVDDAFLQAATQCDREGLRHLWVHDPLRLFPPEKRPTIG